jgi:bacterioferritin
MKGNAKVIERLNSLLTAKLGSISQYMVHAEMCSNWGLTKLSKVVQQRGLDEMKHAQKLISRILFLEGVPAMPRPLDIRIGKDIEEQFRNDLDVESEAILIYNQSIEIAEAEGDRGTADVFDSILLEEEGHLDWLIMQISLIKKLGLENYLAQQVN